MPEARVELARGCPRWILSPSSYLNHQSAQGSIAKHRNHFPALRVPANSRCSRVFEYQRGKRHGKVFSGSARCRKRRHRRCRWRVHAHGRRQLGNAFRKILAARDVITIEHRPGLGAGRRLRRAWLSAPLTCTAARATSRPRSANRVVAISWCSEGTVAANFARASKACTLIASYWMRSSPTNTAIGTVLVPFGYASRRNEPHSATGLSPKGSRAPLGRRPRSRRQRG